MRRTLLKAALAVSLVISPALAADAREQAAAKAVEAWLAIHDAGRYDESWDAAAEYVKKRIPRSKWEDTMQSHRAPLGGVQSRSAQAASYSATLPGMPDGDYVVLQYKTSFEKKNSAIETIIPMLEDGQWKVMTYRIQ
jgi:hypothetical protein